MKKAAEDVDYERALDHERKVKQEWEKKIQDYVSEHYPTQATTSAESTSEQGLREREAMKNDPVLKKMREDAKEATDKVKDASYAALAKRDEAIDNIDREIKELAKTLSDEELDNLYKELRKVGDDMEVVLYDEIEKRQTAREINRISAIEQEEAESVAKCRSQADALLEAVNSGDKGRVKKAKEALTKALLENGVGNRRLRELLRAHKPSRKKDDKWRNFNKAATEAIKAVVKTLESDIKTKLAEAGLEGVHLDWNDGLEAWWLSADKESPYYKRIERIDHDERWIFESAKNYIYDIPPLTKDNTERLVKGIKSELTPSSKPKGRKGNGDKLRYHKAESEQAKADKREKALRDEVVNHMRKAGLDVSMDTEEG